MSKRRGNSRAVCVLRCFFAKKTTASKKELFLFIYEKRLMTGISLKKIARADFSLGFYKVYYVYFSFQTKFGHKKSRASQIKSGTEKSIA